MSDDGRYIALKAADTVFSVDRQSGELVQIAPGDDVSMSGDGQFVAFARHIDDEDDDDDGGYGPDVFVWSRATRAIEQISVTPAGKPSVPEHYGSYVPIISRDGRWVEFISEAADLTPGDTNRSRDVFLRDRRNGVTTRRNVTAQGAQAWNHSNEHAMSRNGRYSVFTSWSENLFGGKLENLVFQDGATRVPRLVTRPGVMPSAGIGAFAVADNGTVVFTALRPGTKYDDVLAIDTGGAARLITRPDGLLVDAERIKVDITTDGRRVFFVSDQPLVADDTNGKSDVYAVDVKTGEIERLSVGPDGRQLDGYCSLKAVSGTGRLVTFSSGDTILSQQGDSKSVLLVRDTVARTTSLLLRKLDASATE